MTVDINPLLGRSDEKGRTALFHGGFQYLERIHHILQALDYCSVGDITAETHSLRGLTARQYEKRLSLLKVLFRELSPKMTEEQKEYNFKVQLFLDGEFQKVRDVLARGGGHVSTRFMTYFDAWEIELRSFADEKGLLMAEKRGDLDATDT